MKKLIDNDVTREISEGDIIAPDFKEHLGQPIAVEVKKNNGNIIYHSIPYTVEKDDDTIKILYHADVKGRSIFLNIIGVAVASAIKKTFPHYSISLIEVTGDEARIDFLSFNEKLDKKKINEIISKSKEIVSNNQICFSLETKNKVLDSLKSQGELIAFYDLLGKQTKQIPVANVDNLFFPINHPIQGCFKYQTAIIEYINQSLVHWKGEETGILLKRLHVTGYPSREDEKIYREYQREVQLRDHVNLGREMDLFMTDPKVGAGLILWPPNGAWMRKTLEDYVFRLHMKRGYSPVITPHLATGELFKTSGHLQHFRENMFVFEFEGRLHSVKPMNCPFHITIFKRKKWSYRELPARFFELGTIYRYERAGTLHGLTRVRGLTQDDAHIFLREDQIEEEINNLLSLVKEIYTAMGITNYRFKLSVRDPEDQEKYMGSKELWDHAENVLEKALEKQGIAFEKELGEAAFYGPKIDIFLKDALGRDWQCGTIQLDFNLPERFDLKYIDENNKEKRPVIIHRAILGSIERFLGILLEYYAGRLPLWLAPIQAVVLPVEESSTKQIEYAKDIGEELRKEGIRTKVMTEGRLNHRLREARKMRVPLIVVLGEKELKQKSLTVTIISYHVDEKGKYKPKEERRAFDSLKQFVSWVKKEISRQTGGILP